MTDETYMPVRVRAVSKGFSKSRGAGSASQVTLMTPNENDEFVGGSETPDLAKEQEAKAIKGDLARLEKSLDEERKRNEELLTSFRHLQADFENYRKRVDREIRDLEEFSTAGLVKKLIPVLDDLELAVDAASKAEDKGLLEGVKMVQKSLGSTLEGEGLQKIQALGKPFDPTAHEAVEMIQGTKGEDTVIEEMRKGYAFKGKVLRPSWVKVEMAGKQEKKEGQA